MASDFKGGLTIAGFKAWHAGNLNPADYYKKTELQTTGQAQVHWGNLTNVPSTFQPATHNHDTEYVNVTGDQMSGALTFTSGAAAPAAGTATALSYGKLQSYGNLLLLADTDGSTAGEYVLIAATRGITPATDQGLKIQQASLTWLGNDVWHAGNFAPSSKADASTTYTKTEVDNKISGLVNSAPAALDTLNELATALGNDANFATTMTTALGNKANSADVYTKTNLQTSGQASVHFSNLTNVPTSFTPAAHTHDDRYYTETELNTSGAGGAVHWNNVTNKPSTFTPGTHDHDGVYLKTSVGGTIDVNAVTGTQLYLGSAGTWTNKGPAGHNGAALLSMNTHGGNYYSQLWFDTAGDNFYHRSIDNGTVRTWRKVWTEGNFNPSNYALSTHTHDFDKYSSWTLKINTDAGQAVTSGGIVDLKGGGATSITRSGNTITISSTDTDTNNYLTGVSGSGNGTVTFTRSGLADLTWSAAHNHDTAYAPIVAGGYLPLSGGTMTGKITTPNSAMGIRLGDDAEIGDGNVANHFVLQGVQDATTGGITFGSAKDTNIYRGGANSLKTDDSFTATSFLVGSTTVIDTSGKIDYTALKNVPTSFTPATHNHDDLYFRGVVGTVAPATPAVNMVWIDMN